MRSRLSRVFISILVTLLFAGIAPAAEDLVAQTSSAAGVTINAKPRGLSDGTWEFEVALNTHS